ncbi:hypothetical protein BC828DRAFT_376080 [Blastocladiella britannica]|nr:hypothetical protein BC828DRAFT_376080 [Blastocladiella britannica]
MPHLGPLVPLFILTIFRKLSSKALQGIKNTMSTGDLHVHIIAARGLRISEPITSSSSHQDPWLRLSYGDLEVSTGPAHGGHQSATWDEKYVLPVFTTSPSYFTIECFNAAATNANAQLIGGSAIAIDPIARTPSIDHWYSLRMPGSGQLAGEVHLAMSFVPSAPGAPPLSAYPPTYDSAAPAGTVVMPPANEKSSLPPSNSSSGATLAAPPMYAPPGSTSPSGLYAPPSPSGLHAPPSPSASHAPPSPTRSLTHTSTGKPITHSGAWQAGVVGCLVGGVLLGPFGMAAGAYIGTRIQKHNKHKHPPPAQAPPGAYGPVYGHP